MRERKPPTRRSKCGTKRGPYNHMANKENPCEECLEILARYTIHGKRRKKHYTPKTGERPPCGTWQGYNWHLTHGGAKTACLPCKAARAARTNAAYRAKREALIRKHGGIKQPPVKREKCGTIQGYNTHTMEFEHPCEPCSAANRERERQRSAAKKRRAS